MASSGGDPTAAAGSAATGSSDGAGRSDRALDGLKVQLDHLFATRGRECFPDPWAARNAYIQVILADDRDAAIGTFLARHGHPDLDEVQVTDALRLLEMQQDAMLMFTSCGWFHDELSGIETVQCLQYAARAMHLAQQFHRDFEAEFVAALQAAPSNVARYRDGRGSGSSSSARRSSTWIGCWPITPSA